jgi:hypothetical protein
VYEFLSWIESSRLGHAMRESGPWTYPLVNLAHLLGVATLFGSVLVVDLTLMGAGRRTSLPAIAAAAAPISKAGFLLAVLSGIGLLASNATEYQGNPFFLIKFPIIAAGLANALVVGRSSAWRALDHRPLTSTETRRLGRLGALSLFCWLSAVAAGRLIGYW